MLRLLCLALAACAAAALADNCPGPTCVQTVNLQGNLVKPVTVTTGVPTSASQITALQAQDAANANMYKPLNTIVYATHVHPDVIDRSRPVVPVYVDHVKRPTINFDSCDCPRSCQDLLPEERADSCCCQKEKEKREIVEADDQDKKQQDRNGGDGGKGGKGGKGGGNDDDDDDDDEPRSRKVSQTTTTTRSGWNNSTQRWESDSETVTHLKFSGRSDDDKAKKRELIAKEKKREKELEEEEKEKEEKEREEKEREDKEREEEEEEKEKEKEEKEKEEEEEEEEKEKEASAERETAPRNITVGDLRLLIESKDESERILENVQQKQQELAKEIDNLSLDRHHMQTVLRELHDESYLLSKKQDAKRARMTLLEHRIKALEDRVRFELEDDKKKNDDYQGTKPNSAKFGSHENDDVINGLEARIKALEQELLDTPSHRKPNNLADQDRFMSRPNFIAPTDFDLRDLHTLPPSLRAASEDDDQDNDEQDVVEQMKGHRMHVPKSLYLE